MSFQKTCKINACEYVSELQSRVEIMQNMRPNAHQGLQEMLVQL